MKLTDEERWMMNEVAINYAKQSDDFDDAWRRAAEFLEARRRVIGQPKQDDIGEPIDNDLRLAAEALYPHRWTCDTLPSDEQAAMWSALRDALGLPPGTATAAGVAAPTAEAVSEEIVGWYVEGGSLQTWRTFDLRDRADEIAQMVGGTVVPLVRKGSPRGVVVTLEQRWAVEWAMGFAQANSFHALAGQLSSLLDAIYAAKGGPS